MTKIEPGKLGTWMIWDSQEFVTFPRFVILSVDEPFPENDTQFVTFLTEMGMTTKMEASKFSSVTFPILDDGREGTEPGEGWEY
jgi:hypothetical protein